MGGKPMGERPGFTRQASYHVNFLGYQSTNYTNLTFVVQFLTSGAHCMTATTNENRVY